MKVVNGVEVLEEGDEGFVLKEPKGNEDEGAEDLRVKINIQNRLLKKAGYEFDEEKKEWIKKPVPESKPQEKQPEVSQMSEKDLYALTQAGIHIDDVDEVKSYAQFKKISVADALKDKTLQTILQNKKEERATADATQTKGPRGAAAPSGDDLLNEARSTGKLPETDEGLNDLVRTRLESKRKQPRS